MEGNTGGIQVNEGDKHYIMLVIVAITFVALRAPYTAAYYLLHYRSNIFSAESLKTATENLNIATNIGYALIVMNYSLNFFLCR